MKLEPPPSRENGQGESVSPAEKSLEVRQVETGFLEEGTDGTIRHGGSATPRGLLPGHVHRAGLGVGPDVPELDAAGRADVELEIGTDGHELARGTTTALGADRLPRAVDDEIEAAIVAYRHPPDLFVASVELQVGGALGGPAREALGVVGEALHRLGSRSDEQACEAIDADGAPEIRVVVSEAAHVTVFKALRLLGFGRRRLIAAPVDGHARVDPARLPALDDRTILCLQAGEVNTGEFDPFGPLIDASREAGAWPTGNGSSRSATTLITPSFFSRRPRMSSAGAPRAIFL